MQAIDVLERPPAAPPRAPDIRRSLLQIVRGEILPRLLTAHRRRGDEADPRRLARLAIGPKREGAADYLAYLRRRGCALEALLLDTLPLAARRLGALWERDSLDFVGVTEGLGRLSAAARALLDELTPTAAAPPGPRALFALAPGETHRLGVEIAQGMFRAAGFAAEIADDFEAQLAQTPYALLGFSISCDRYVEPLRHAVRAARAAPRGRDLVILLGGPLVARQPDLAQKIGADAAICDMRAAILLARGLVESRINM